MAGVNPSLGQYQLETLSPTGKAPKERLSDAAQAKQIYWLLWEANKKRNLAGAVMQGMIDGNPPYKQSALRADNQGWRANFNSLEAKARKDAAKTPYYDLFSATPQYAAIQTKIEGPMLSAQRASGVITEEFDRMLKAWPGFDFSFWQMLDDFVAYGRGWLMPCTYDGWYFECVPWHKVLFPDGVGATPEKWSFFAVQHAFDPTRLNEWMEDEEAAGDAGWNVEEVQSAIRNAVPRQASTQQDAMYVQQAIRDQDMYITAAASTIQCASIFVRQFDGTWSRMIIETEQEISGQQWLYKKEDIGSDILNVIAPFFFDVGPGSLNGIGGMARDIFEVIKAKDRMRCEQVNNVFLRSTVLVQPQNASGSQKSALIRIGGGISVIPAGFNVLQSTMLGDIQSTMVVNQSLDNMLDQNTGIYRPSFEKPPGNPETATGAQIRFTQSTVLTNSAVNRFYKQLDRFYAEIYRRAANDLPTSDDPSIKAAKQFQKACRDRGVSASQLRETYSVRSVRSIGNGSPAMRQQMTAEMMQVLPFLGTRGRSNWLEKFIAARGGQESVEDLMPPEDQSQEPTNQERQAIEENGLMKIGVEIPVVQGDDHIAHLIQHYQGALGSIQAAQEGGHIPESASFLATLMPHALRHIELVPIPQIQKQFKEQWAQIEQQQKQMVQQAQANQNQQAQQQSVMSEIQLSAMKTQAGIEDKNRKTQAGIADKNLKTRHSLATSDAMTANSIRTSTATAITKIQIDKSKARATNGASKN